MKHITKTLFILALSLAFGHSAFAATVPSVTTVEAQYITKTSATLVMAVTSDGGSPLTSYSIQYGKTTAYGSTTQIATNANGPLGSSFTSGGLGSTTLTCGTTYHYRGYAVNSVGTGYGTDKTFKTSACPIGSSFTGTALSPTLINTLPTTTSTVVLPTTTVLPSATITTLPIAPTTPTTPSVPAIPTTTITVPLAPQLPTIPVTPTPTTPAAPTTPTVNVTPMTVINQNLPNFNLPNTDTVVVTPSQSPQSNDDGSNAISYSYSTSGGSTSAYIPTVTVAPLRPKMKSSNVAVLQWVLKVKGTYTGNIDGSYGPKTKTAVKNYQKSAKVLKADGYAGKKTLGHLGILIKTK